jgi:hypothetical protein
MLPIFHKNQKSHQILNEKKKNSQMMMKIFHKYKN